MGWTSYRATHYKRGKIDKKAEMDHEFGKNLNWGTIVKSAVVGGTYYAAIHSTKHDVTWGLVCLVRTENNSEIFYKDMDETSGPYCYDCPKGILDVLTPLDDPRFDYLGKESKEWAQKWRDGCKAKRESKKTAITMHHGKNYKAVSVSDLKFGSTGSIKVPKGTEVTILSLRNSWYIPYNGYNLRFMKRYWEIKEEL